MSKREEEHVTGSARVLWRKSAASGGGNCVEVGFTEEVVLIRNSKAPSGPVVSFSRSEWVAFLVGVRDGEFDCAVPGDART
jgi:predicted secreted Zn-dependent protease